MQYPFYFVNGIDLYDFANVRMDAYLDEDTLYIEYCADDARVVILPVWGIIQQFDFAKDKKVMVESFLGFSSGGSTAAVIFLSVR